MCSQKFKSAILVESCPHTNSVERDQRTTFDKISETLVVWPEASMACRWGGLSKLRSRPDLYCILMSSQASYMTHLNFKETFVDFNLSLQKYFLCLGNKGDPAKERRSFCVGSIFNQLSIDNYEPGIMLPKKYQ